MGAITKHAASVRRQPATFEQADGGWRVTYFGDPNVWEVVCPGCGDDLGPIVLQPERVQVLRGPYRSEEKAWEAAVAHERLMKESG